MNNNRITHWPLLVLVAVLLTVCALAFLWTEGVAAQDSVRLGDNCGLDGAVSATMTDWRMSWDARALSAAEMAALASMEGDPIAWIAEGDYGRFDMPPLNALPVEYDVLMPDGDVQYVMVWTHDDVQYIFGFNSLEVTTDAAGNHEGFHDICAMLRSEP